MSALLQDVRTGGRALARARGMALAALLTLGLGTGTAVALAACYVPARRALRVDPLTALRTE